MPAQVTHTALATTSVLQRIRTHSPSPFLELMVNLLMFFADTVSRPAGVRHCWCAPLLVARPWPGARTGPWTRVDETQVCAWRTIPQHHPRVSVLLCRPLLTHIQNPLPFSHFTTRFRSPLQRPPHTGLPPPPPHNYQTGLATPCPLPTPPPPPRTFFPPHPCSVPDPCCNTRSCSTSTGPWPLPAPSHPCCSTRPCSTFRTRPCTTPALWPTSSPHTFSRWINQFSVPHRLPLSATLLCFLTARQHVFSSVLGPALPSWCWSVEALQCVTARALISCCF